MNAAVVLAAGKGSRMNSRVAKQYMELEGKPVLYYSLIMFEKHPKVDRIVLVTAKEDLEWCRAEIVQRYGLTKVCDVVAGGRERYDSVYEGLKAAGPCDYVCIHDGARPMITEDILDRCLEDAAEYGSGVAGMPVKDTIKLVDEKGTVKETPPRKFLWQVQTPQVFSYKDIRRAYELLYDMKLENVTDDAMVLEGTLGLPVHMSLGSYENMKITTPEDLLIAGAFLQKRQTGV